IWDILINLEDESQLILRHAVNVPILMYLSSRFFSFAFLITCTLYYFRNIKNCKPGCTAAVAFYIISTNSTSLLFLLRVRAVFHGSPLVKKLFLLLWFAVAGTSSLDFLFVKAEHSTTDSKRCIFVHQEVIYSLVAISIALIFDTMVYIAISYRLFKWFTLDENNHRSVRDRAKSLFIGKHLPVLGRSLLRDGQFYYL
ncbi:hypothetical protein K435DRAFT_683230, partial [Dendrothele bispora CBS 962.96]